ncbi:MAG: polymerase sigma factor SigC [Acidimicrobiaceae bacterium]|nr:polymerase sigma factor SigC [Acidimicrobiaceae bacterium]
MDELSRLLDEAKHGDGASLAELVRRTQPDVWRFCAHVGGPDEADDATQEVFLALWRALPSFRGEASARTFLFVIARRTLERLSRRRRRWSELAAGAPAPAPASLPGQRLELAELLAGLDPDRRTALVLTQVLGLSYAEAAAACECPLGTIRSRVARAREDLLALRQRDERSARTDTETALGS